MAIDYLKNNFTAGELSPLSIARSDIERYANGASVLENWQVLTQGGIQRRPGTRFVANGKFRRTLTVLRAFEVSKDAAYVLELGEEYIRFFTDGTQILDGGVPVEVATPYQSRDLRGLRSAQSNKIMILVHPDYPPAQLSRLSDTLWTYKPIVFDPPPLYESGHAFRAQLILSALTGEGITIVADDMIFLAADVDRVITSGDGRAVITSVTSASIVQADVLSDFLTLTIAQGDWTLEGSPVAQCRPSDTGPVGKLINLDLELEQEDNPDLVTNGDFSSGLSGWDNLSGPFITSGTNDGSTAEVLSDSTADFWNDGVRPGQRIKNTTDNTEAEVFRVRSPQQLECVEQVNGGVLSDGTDWATNDTYEVWGTGGAQVRNDKAFLTGNVVGIGWIEQEITTINGRAYRVEFRVSEGPVSFQVGSASGKSDIEAELSYEQGNKHEVVFVAEGASSFIQFRNNQPAAGAVDQVSMRLQSIEGWRSEDVGRYVAINGGLVKITAFTSAFRVRGEVIRELSSDDVAGTFVLQAPAWSDDLGYPSVVAFFEGRLYFAGSEEFPQTIWGSAVDDFYNFFFGVTGSDAVRFPIVDSAGNITLNLIRWLMPSENLLAGTTHAEYRLFGPADGGFTAASPPNVRLQSAMGSADVQPLRVGQAIIFAQRQGSKLQQMALDADVSTAYLPVDLSILSGHLLEDHSIVELHYAPEPISMIWALRSDGTPLTITYNLSEKVVAWHHMTTPGLVESMAVIPHPTKNAYQVWLLVNRTVGTVENRYIEYIDAWAPMTYKDNNDVQVSWRGLTVDCGVTYAGVAKATFSGLPYPDGAELAVVGDGIVFPPKTVQDGAITIEQAVRSAFLGLAYDVRGLLLPPEAAGPRGSILRRNKHYKELSAFVYQSVGLTINGEVVHFRTPGMRMDQGVPPFTGARTIDGLLQSGEGWPEPMIEVVQPDPLPATILAIHGVLEVEGES